MCLELNSNYPFLVSQAPRKKILNEFYTNSNDFINCETYVIQSSVPKIEINDSKHLICVSQQSVIGQND